MLVLSADHVYRLDNGDGPALVAEEAQVPRGTRVPPGGRFTPDGPKEAT